MLEQQHPIPQQISSYQFRLVGDMTLNQFFQVAAGALISLAFYASGLHPVVKWPLVAISFILGIAFAFFPLQDRPLPTWIVLFAKAIYSPTIYVWKKGAETRQFFAPDTVPTPKLISGDGTTPQSPLAQLVTYDKPENEKALDQQEEAFLEKVDKQLDSSATVALPAVEIKRKETPAINASIPAPQQPGKTTIFVPQITPVVVEKEKKEVIDKQVEVAQTKQQASPTLSPFQGQAIIAGKSVNFMPEASPPEPPKVPNVVVGQVFENDGKIVDGAILEILNEKGTPARALKSNRLGHFMIVTPLTNGKYILKAEKEGLNFEPASFEARGAIIPPIAVIADKKEESN